MTPSAPIINALSFDIEDWFHMVEIEAVADTSKWSSLPSIVEKFTDEILQMLAERNIRATFFILGWIAERYPALIQRIAQGTSLVGGQHELASHSFWHRKVYELSPDEFREDVKRSIDAIETASQRNVIGFRAPSFSIIPGCEWAFDILHELGIRYDASLFPIARGHGGYPCPPHAHQFTNTPSGKPMTELPMSIMKLGPKRIAFSGGGYLRALPTPIIRMGMNQLNSRNIPAVTYLHPRDFAVDCPRVPMPLARKFKSYVGLKSTRRKFQMLLEEYRWDTCAAVLGLQRQ